MDAYNKSRIAKELNLTELDVETTYVSAMKKILKNIGLEYNDENVRSVESMLEKSSNDY